ncbi:hypothetical protein BFF78_19820 [Streptomyces fodineus]|uniref:UspA domain-containing protein n=1 Tax=Streptomyces fodineus TaxID=1904616 RepID=A0A1D7YNP4_9ACTN|nr:universal stress protein [Streptomyces fodineus]AOR37197.1 hypothetical protein BFF78_19820 [Streptomyces fodineus]
MSEYRLSSPARVVVGVSGSLGGATVLGRAASEAGRRGAELWPVLAWEPPEGDSVARRFPSASVMAGQWERLARERLLTALREVFGGTDTGLPGQALVVRGAPGPALVRTAGRENDILVIGTGARGLLHRALWPSVSRYCLAHARCPVLAVPPSPLQAELAAAHRRNTWRLRLNTGHLERELHTMPPQA